MTAPPPATAVAPAADLPLVRLGHADGAELEALLADLRRIARAGTFTLGEPVEAFQEEFAAYCGATHAIGVSSGTDALALALRALHVGPGDEVILPANSFIATAEAVSAVGAAPRLVDVDPDTHLITAAHVAAALGPKVRCVIPVHLHGSTVDLDPILELTRAEGVAVVEDACQAHGAWYRGRRVGTLGDLGCFSFYPTKNLGGWGDGGAVVTDDGALADRVRMLRSHGERERHHHELVGTTARLDAMQAAVLRVKLRGLDAANDERRALAAALRAPLEQAEVSLPARPFPEADHVYHLFVVRSRARDALRLHLQGAGIATAVHYPKPIHLTEAYAHLGMGAGALPVCEELARRQCTIPLFPGMTPDEVRRVADAVVEAFAAEARLLAGR